MLWTLFSLASEPYVRRERSPGRGMHFPQCPMGVDCTVLLIPRLNSLQQAPRGIEARNGYGD
jgi:hypothetical protein